MSLEQSLAAALANPKAGLVELDRIDCEQSLAQFLHDGWRYIDPAPYMHGWHLEAIAEHLEAVTSGDIRRLIVNIPPRHSKSSVVSVAWPVWTWAQKLYGPLSGPHVQFLSASYAQQLSTRDALKSRRLIQSPWFQDRWGDRFQLTGDQNAKMRYENDAGGYRIATSVDGGLTGEGGSVIIVDDPLNAREAQSDVVRQSAISWWDEAMSTRLNDPKTGAYVVIMQRLHEEDLTGHILASNHEDWEHLCLPARYEVSRHCVTSIGWEDPREADGDILAPERFDDEALTRLERALGPYAAAGQLQQRPSPKGGGILKREWWRLWDEKEARKHDCVHLAFAKRGERDADGKSYREGQPIIDPETGEQVKRVSFPRFSYIVGVVDTAYTEKEENDPSAMTIWGVWEDEFGLPKLMLITAWRERLEFHDLCERVAYSARRYKVDNVLVEAKASGMSVYQELRRLHAGNGWGIELIDPGRQDKVARVHSIVPVFSEEMVYAPDKEWAEMVIAECEGFPKGTHDDLVDTVSAAIRHLRDGGMLLHGSEVAQDLGGALAYKPVNTKPLYPA